MIHRQFLIKEKWIEDHLNPFDELILSWNASRPIEGEFLFYVSVKLTEWSPWLLYASWGSKGQSSFTYKAQNIPVRTYQDTLEILEEKKATGFQIKIQTKNNASLNLIQALHVYTNSDKIEESSHSPSDSSSVYLKVPGLSQMTLNHIRHKSLCSPTAVTAVARYLSNSYSIDPLYLAENVWDCGFDLFGNWVFNIAQASIALGTKWNCWVEKLNNFNSIYHSLHQGIPVIASVRGPLKGSTQNYASGHLMAVIGYDSFKQKVICMDPAFPTNEETHVFYNFLDFVQAWNRRGNVAYIFSKRN